MWIVSPIVRKPFGRGRWAWAAVAVFGVIAIPVVVWAGARIGGGDDGQPPGGVAGDPGVSHVHGLGINPADGSLVVATHYGSFRIPSDGGEAIRIGNSFQDTMGFTVAGPDQFLGSGHPDLAGSRAGQPGRLGLIASTDGGVKWNAISLSGEVDFHGLVFAHDRVYGWDSGSGRFMVSRNQRDWETRATLDLFAFAVDPDDADHLIGAGPDGMVESRDEGRTWTGTDGAQIVTLSWERNGELWGIDAAGVVWHRAASEWNRSGRLPGQPQAFLATADALFAAADDNTDDVSVTGIYRSTDQGRTWELRYRDPQ